MKFLVIAIFILVTCLNLVSCDDSVFTNDRPIVGILAVDIVQPTKSPHKDKPFSHITASFVKFIEASGARVVPIWIGKPRKYYETILAKING